MRLFILAALIFLIIAFILIVAPAHFLIVPFAWVVLAGIAFLVDLLTGYAVPINGNRAVVRRGTTQPVQ